MSQSTTRRNGRNWMDRQRAFDAEGRLDKARVEADPLVRLMNARRGALDYRVAQLRGLGRVPRVCLYALATRDQVPTHSLNGAREFAARQDWQVGAGQCFTDHFGPTDPFIRPGWSLVRHQIRFGYADGVMTLTHSVISPLLVEYELQLDLVNNYLGFIALATSETAGGQQ
ncbi:hypothetical protein E0L36_21785 [Streptomyces sp. AJS327]|uniref:hypothetical protein n=1 Tax=Streptomyces sp. AJS327 TaxID=2545265 RepID=UPI0015E0142F|nr:hypothetical protein [Streptomyces sp. AJS327]MBA0053409.1 hypothetical protein [Streptomyces sp. AJS327]